MAGALPEVLGATGSATTSYVQVQGQVLAQYDSGTWAYVLPDHLGSVRQLAAGDASVELAQTYTVNTPYGEVLSSSGSGSSLFGYTGEPAEPTGLVYLRARYYQPAMGRFVSKDVWPGDTQHPQSLHGWQYVGANPINFTDPTGRTLFPPPQTPDARDLTDWLVRELQANANSREVRTMSIFNHMARIYYRGGRTETAGLLFGIAGLRWRALVKDGARWDFKDQIEKEMDISIMLCHAGGCEWYDYSLPGNIHYGYVGRAAGFSRETLHGGASYAEITDPAHRDEEEIISWVLINIHNPAFFYCLDLYVNFSWWSTGFDDPTDFTAVDLGSALYNRAGSHVSLANFGALLQKYSPQLMHQPAPSTPYHNSAWPYPLRYFDGGK